MSAKGGTVLIVAPFWRHAPHVGIHRVERFVRWLHESGVRIVLVRAGGTENVTATEWGTEITVRDPIGLYRDPTDHAHRSGAEAEAACAGWRHWLCSVRMPRSSGPAAPATTRWCSRTGAEPSGSSRRVRPSRSTWPRQPWRAA